VSLLVHPRRRRAPFARLALALVVAVVVNLAIFSLIARLLAGPAPAVLPALVELGRAEPPHALPLAPVPVPHAAPAPTTPPPLPTLDLGALASDHAFEPP
jgi:hypothetical protein